MLSSKQYKEAQEKALGYFLKAGIILTEKEKAAVEIADFGLGELDIIGLEVLVYVNTKRVCAKELVMFPDQTCPEHIHPTRGGVPGKEETFRCRWGKVYLYVSGERNCMPRKEGLGPHGRYLMTEHEIILGPGGQYTLGPDTLHWFRAGKEGAVVSEFSTSSTDDQDIFTDPQISRFTKID
jgi:D-lyxose ketol-isomerase